jgi:pimeloyl-ACP methyl ester carboxylesterase
MWRDRPSGRLRAGALVLAASFASLLFPVVAADAKRTSRHHPKAARIVDLPVSFHVLDVNRSLLPCPSDGAPETIAGRLVAPASVLAHPARAATVTVYLHEFSFGKWFWNFPDPAYDYAALEARAGHVSVLIDRLGYGESSHPNGFATCLGADADEEHQIVLQLRAGSYSLVGAASRSFQHVVLAGHSGGALDSEVEAYSFGGIDGLIIFAQADQDPTALGTQEGLREGLTCGLGGEPSYPSGPGGYAYFGQTTADWERDYFHDADPRVVAAAAALRHRDPCGDVGSFVQGLILDHLYVPRITVPVLLLYGLGDALFAQPAAGRDERALFTGSRDVSLSFFPGAGHALTLQRSAPAVRQRVSQWLNARGLG